ncbi:MAG: anti-sigma factor [Proteobacteria bacterium]|nr:anti-sigma factor [Pseudomonadota bacterium]
MSSDSFPTAPIREEDLHAFVDGHLDADRRREVQDYLDRHPQEARQVAGFAARRQDLRNALASVAEEPVPARLNLERMVAEHRAPSPWPWRAAAAVLMAFGLGGFGGWYARTLSPERSSAGIAALAREATSSYAVYAADPTRPVEMGADSKAELVTWVSSRLQRQVSIPDLTKSGFRFIGGRLVSTEHGPAGMFIYDGAGGTRLAMIVRPMSIEQDTPMMKRSAGPLAGFTWATRGLGFSVVAPEAPENLHPLADEVRRQIASTL